MEKIATYEIAPMDVANWFLCHIDREAGDSITHLKLQKLMYYAQAWTMALNDKALFENDFQAWAHGPVLPEIYDAYKSYGFQSLPSCDCDYDIPEEAEEVLFEVQRIYGEKSARALENLTHEEAPWVIAREGRGPEEKCSTIISKESMIKYYQSMLAT